MDSQNSACLSRKSRRTPDTSAKPMAAAMTTAPSAAVGRLVKSPGTNTRSAATAIAPTNPVTWVLAPADSATGVREALLLTGNPWKRPAAAFATPSATISRFGSTSVPGAGGERAGENARVGKGHQRDAGGAAQKKSQVRPPHRGRTQARQPARNLADDGYALLGQSEPADRDGGKDHRQEYPGNSGHPSLEHEDEHQTPQAQSERGRIRQPGGHAARDLDDARHKTRGFHRETEHIGHLAHQDGERDAVDEAVAHGLREEFGDEPEVGQPGPDQDQPHQNAERSGQSDGPRSVACGQRQKGGRDQR